MRASININTAMPNIKGKEVISDVAEISTVSASTKNIFKEPAMDASNCKSMMSSDHLSSALLREKALASTMGKLRNAKEHEIRDKIFAILKSALTIAILVSAVLVTVMAGCPLITATVCCSIIPFAYLMMVLCNAFLTPDLVPGEVGRWLGGTLPGSMPGAIWMYTPFFPIYEAFSRISRLERRISEQQQTTNTNFLGKEKFKEELKGANSVEEANSISKCDRIVPPLSFTEYAPGYGPRYDPTAPEVGS